MKTETCKLCLKEKVLRNSHILPEFMYQNLYNSDIRRFYSFAVNLEVKEKSKSRIEQKGIREYLLCQSCETQLSRYENYASETIYGKNLNNKTYIVKASETIDLKYFAYDYAGFEFTKFRLFLLSILWRLIISKTFKTPKIDGEIIEKLRLAIHQENPLEYDEFGCLLQVIKYKKGQLAKGFILEPFLTSSDETDILNILIDGFMYSFYLNKIQIEKERNFFLKEDGTMTILGRILFEDKTLFEKLKSAFEIFKI